MRELRSPLGTGDGPARPQVGQHNRYFYGTWLGMSTDEIERYSAEGGF